MARLDRSAGVFGRVLAPRHYPADMGCQFIQGEFRRGEPPNLCGAARWPGSPYCGEHCLQCYEASPEQREDRA